MCCAGCTAGTVDEGPGLIHSSGGSPGPVGDPASPWRPWTAGRALTDGPGSGSGMAHPTRGGQGHGWSPGSLHGCECCSETRHSGYMLRSFGNRCCVCFLFFFLLCLFHFLFSVSNHTFPREFLPVVMDKVKSAGPRDLCHRGVWTPPGPLAKSARPPAAPR